MGTKTYWIRRVLWVFMAFLEQLFFTYFRKIHLFITFFGFFHHLKNNYFDKYHHLKFRSLVITLLTRGLRCVFCWRGSASITWGEKSPGSRPLPRSCLCWRPQWLGEWAVPPLGERTWGWKWSVPRKKALKSFENSFGSAIFCPSLGVCVRQVIDVSERGTIARPACLSVCLSAGSATAAARSVGLSACLLAVLPDRAKKARCRIARKSATFQLSRRQEIVLPRIVRISKFRACRPRQGSALKMCSFRLEDPP